MAISADGRIAVSGSEDRTVRLWDTASGDCLRTLTGHTDDLESVAISGDAGVVVSASRDRTLRAWALDWDYRFHGIRPGVNKSPA